MNTKCKWIARFLALTLLSLSSITNHAAVFNIVPEAPLPTSLPQGSAVTAYYTVINTTGAFYSGNYVKYLPPNVTQVTADGTVPNLCGTTFSLAANASCTLELYITGTVNAYNSNPREHLFVCLGGCSVCCAGTHFPLNVIATAPLPIIAAGTYSVASPPRLYPLLATSSTGGTTWLYTIDSNTPMVPAGYYNQGVLNGFNGSSCAGLNCIAVGSYQTVAMNNPTYPLVASSTNGGATWVYTIDSHTSPSVPSDYTSSGSFISASCAGLNCIAAGSYQTVAMNNPTYPLVASSTNGGATWAYTIDNATSGLPMDYKSGVLIGTAMGVFASSTCNGLTCIAAGSYQSINMKAYPFLASSTNGGTTWTFPITSNTLPADYYGSGIIYSVSCNNQICIAVGSYQTTAMNNPTYPFVAKSNDSGATWMYTLDDQTPQAVPTDYYNSAVFGSISCTMLHCIAAGYYTSQASGHPQYPLLATSVDGGNTWIYTIDSQTHPSVPTDFKLYGAFTSTSCSGSTCIAAGLYVTNPPFITYPLLASSRDAGVTWTYAIDSQTTPSVPAGFTSFGAFNSASCNGLICVVSGQYSGNPNPPNIQYPFIASSTDGGATWTYTLDSTQPALPRDYVTAGNLNTASISSNTTGG